MMLKFGPSTSSPEAGMSLGRGDVARATTTSPRRRFDLSAEPKVIYVVGDVHGCLSDLLELEASIFDDARAYKEPRAIVMLGDYVDRGKNSASVLDHLSTGSPAGFYRICLAGNHDAEFLALLEGRIDAERWIDFAGSDTLLSYGCDLNEYVSGMRLDVRRLEHELRVFVPEAHRSFLRSLLASLSTPRFFFTHAGARPGIPLSEQEEVDLLWIREPFMGCTKPFEKIVVHGHTVVSQPHLSGIRISVDTGAFLGNGLTAARICSRGVAFLSSKPSASRI